MKYEQFTKSSRKYKYGENKELKTREMAMQKLKKLEMDIVNSMSLDGLYSLIQKREIREVGKDTLQLIITLKFLRIFD